MRHSWGVTPPVPPAQLYLSKQISDGTWAFSLLFSGFPWMGVCAGNCFH